MRKTLGGLFDDCLPYALGKGSLTKPGAKPAVSHSDLLPLLCIVWGNRLLHLCLVDDVCDGDLDSHPEACAASAVATEASF